MRVKCWMLKVECCVLNYECWILSVECWVLSLKCWVLNAQSRVLRIKCWADLEKGANSGNAVWGNLLTLWKFGSLNENKSKDNFLIPPIQESPDWGNSWRARFSYLVIMFGLWVNCDLLYFTQIFIKNKKNIEKHNFLAFFFFYNLGMNALLGNFFF